MIKKTLLVEFSDQQISKHLLELNKKINFIHTWTSNDKNLNNNNYNFIFNQDCINGKNFKKCEYKKNYFKNLSNQDKNIILNLIKRQNPNNNMPKKTKVDFINYLISNWVNFLIKNKIKKVIFSSTPHLCYSYSIYVASKIIGRDYLIFEKTKYLDFYYFTKDINKINAILLNYNKKNKDIQKYINQFKSKKTPNTNDPLENENFFEIIKIVYSFTLKPFLKEKNIINYFFKNQISKFHNYSKFLPINKKADHSKFKDDFFYLKSYIKSKRLLSRYNYNSLNTYKLEKKYKYILFSSNFQPEKSTSPDGGIYYNQIEILKKLEVFCKSKKNFKILYKEHPSQFLYKRFGFIEKDEKYYDEVYNIKNIIFLPLNFDTKIAIKKSSIIATATSEIGAQSLLLNKFCLLFGTAWFEDLPNIIKINFTNQEKINKVISSVINKNKKFDKNIFFKLTNKNNFYLNRKLNKINSMFLKFLKKSLI